MSTKDKSREIIAFVKRYGFKLIRKKKHLIFENQDGLRLVTSRTPGDHRAFQNIETNIKRLLKNHDSNHTS